MSVKIKTAIDSLFDWLNEDAWEWIADDTAEYAYLDHIYWCLVEGRNPSDFEDLRGKTKEELEDEYKERFPLFFARVLRNIASEIETGEIELKIDFKPTT